MHFRSTADDERRAARRPSGRRPSGRRPSDRHRAAAAAIALLASLSACATSAPTRPPLPVELGWHEALQLGLDDLDADLTRLDAALAALPEDAPPAERLALLAERDARVDGAWEALVAAVPRHARTYAERPLRRRLYTARVANAQALRALLDRVGWFTRSEFGALADRRAWTLVQHADHDLELQRRTLVVLEGLAEVGETDPRHVAYLTDRVAVAEGRPQVYGTQGRCASGGWRPEPIVEPEQVDARRAAVGLPPLADQVREAAARCR